MTELEKIEYTKAFIDKLATGVNPLDDTEIPNNDLLNNVRISRCMFYVSGILQSICNYLKTQASSNKKKTKNLPFSITVDQLWKYKFDENSLYISGVADKINELVDLNEVGKLKTHSITEWLLNNDLLELHRAQNGKDYKSLTPKGEELGIISESRISKSGQSYIVLLYPPKAQRYILDHIAEITEINNKKLKKTSNVNLENQGKPWDSTQDEQLIRMFNDGLVVSAIAAEMKRSDGGIRARLVKLGLIENRNDVS